MAAFNGMTRDKERIFTVLSTFLKCGQGSHRWIWRQISKEAPASRPVQCLLAQLEKSTAFHLTTVWLLLQPVEIIWFWVCYLHVGYLISKHQYLYPCSVKVVNETILRKELSESLYQVIFQLHSKCCYSCTVSCLQRTIWKDDYTMSYKMQ